MAKLEWRLQGSQGRNVADFMETKFVIEFDGPGTFIAYLLDNQIVRKERCTFNDAVLWCQTQADRLEAEAKEAETPEDRIAEDPTYKAALDMVNNFMANNSVGALSSNSTAVLMANMVEMVFAAHVAGVEEAKQISEEVSEDHQRDCEPELSSGAHSVKRALERRIRILKGEDAAAVDRDMNKF
jgi:hypothetical protein